MTRHQGRLSEYGTASEIDLDRLTPAERRAFVAVELNDVGPRAHADETDRSPGTVSNLLRRAREKIEVDR